MKKFLFLALALLVGLTALAVPTSVRVNLLSGDKLVVSFDDQPEIAMLADGIKISSLGADPVTFEFDRIDCIDFVSQSLVDNLDASTLAISNLPDRIEISNAEEGSRLQLTGLDGKVYLVAEVAGGQASIIKGDFPKGIYVVTVGKKSFKVAF